MKKKSFLLWEKESVWPASVAASVTISPFKKWKQLKNRSELFRTESNRRYWLNCCCCWPPSLSLLQVTATRRMWVRSGGWRRRWRSGSSASTRVCCPPRRRRSAAWNSPVWAAKAPSTASKSIWRWSTCASEGWSPETRRYNTWHMQSSVKWS